MKKNNYILVIILLLLTNLSFAQGTWEWAHLLWNNSGANEISTDKSGNSYLTGYCNGQINIDTQTTILGDTGAVVLKLNSSGNLMWAKLFSGGLIIKSICSKEKGGCYITGDYHDSAFFDTLHLYSQITQAYFLSLDSAGNIEWLFNANGESSSLSVVCDNSNNPIFTGTYTDTLDIKGNLLMYDPIQNYGAYVFKSDEYGNVLWSHNIVGRFNFYDPRAIAVGKNDDVFISVDVYDTTFFDSDTIFTELNVIVNYDSSGSQRWVRSFADGDLYSVSLKVNKNGQFFIAGLFEHHPLFQTIQLHKLGGFDNDGFIASYDSSLNVLWVNQHHCTGDASIRDLNIGENNLVYFAGQFDMDSLIISNSNLTIHSQVSYNQGYYGICDTSGAILSIATYAGDNGTRIELDSLNNYYLLGNSTDTITFPPFNLPVTNGGTLFAKHTDLTTQINFQVSNKSFSIFPNPSSGKFNIQTGDDADYHLNAYNLIGEKVFSSFVDAANTSIDLPFSPGLYFIEIITGEERLVSKVVVN